MSSYISLLAEPSVGKTHWAEQLVLSLGCTAALPPCSSKGFSGGAYIRLQNKSGPWGMSRHARAVLYVVSAVT